MSKKYNRNPGSNKDSGFTPRSGKMPPFQPPIPNVGNQSNTPSWGNTRKAEKGDTPSERSTPSDNPLNVQQAAAPEPIIVTNDLTVQSPPSEPEEPNWRYYEDYTDTGEPANEKYATESDAHAHFKNATEFAQNKAKDFAGKFEVTQDELSNLTRFQLNPEQRNKVWVFLIGIVFTAVSLAGALFGYVRAYNRFYKAKMLPAYFYPMSKVTKMAMLIGAILAWVVLVGGALSIITFFVVGGMTSGFIIGYLAINFFMTTAVFAMFTGWQASINNSLIEGEKFGSARWARPDELEALAKNETGFYIGKYLFNDKGHILTVAGTRGGKGTNLIIPNLLNVGGIETSFIVIDPKGENAAITANHQRRIGKNVIILNPWGLLSLHVGDAQSYNPLDMLDLSSIHLIDDIQIIAEMIVPQHADAKDAFWTDSARTVISGLLLHLITSETKDKLVLKMLWEWARLPEVDWNTLVAKMATSTHFLHGNTIKNAGREILKLQAAGEETFGGIMSSVLQATDFLKSPALQKSLESGFDPKTLVDGKSTVYVIIPSDKLRTHSRWLRLVVTSMMRSVIRKPNKRVTFLLDEFAALGYMPEIETALSTYAGYNVTVWPILQSLIQLKNLYKDNWETFIANCTVRQYFTINDNFSAEYISKAVGETTNVIKTILGGKRKDESNRRLLITPDELRRASGKKMFMFIGDLPPTFVDKQPYYEDDVLNELADRNPYLDYN